MNISRALRASVSPPPGWFKVAAPVFSCAAGRPSATVAGSAAPVIEKVVYWRALMVTACGAPMVIAWLGISPSTPIVWAGARPPSVWVWAGRYCRRCYGAALHGAGLLGRLSGLWLITRPGLLHREPALRRMVSRALAVRARLPIGPEPIRCAAPLPEAVFT